LSSSVKMDIGYICYINYLYEIIVQDFIPHKVRFNSLLEKYKINGVSHFYALFALAQHCLSKKIEAKAITTKLDEFYDCLRNSEELDPNVKAYQESMQANTRSKSQRLKRINALIQYCGA